MYKEYDGESTEDVIFKSKEQAESIALKIREQNEKNDAIQREEKIKALEEQIKELKR
jgi:phosphopantetheine adenylyltransferase